MTENELRQRADELNKLSFEHLWTKYTDLKAERDALAEQLKAMTAKYHELAAAIVYESTRP
jgi:hypothetical protein